MKSDLFSDLQSRGFIHQATDLNAIDYAATQGPITAYIGFDLTAPTLHVGSLIQIMALMHLKRHGHNPIVMLGTSTTRIGDPSGKTSARPMLDQHTIEQNAAGISRTLTRILGNDVNFMWNDWFDMNYIDFIRHYGPHFTINRMLTMDSVKSRLDRNDPMTFIEFNYMILQSVDFLELASRHDCTLQIGGSDQWGNIVNGVDLVRRVLDKKVHGLTTPLMTNSAGEKMGKTAAGAVWLDPALTSPFDFWQFWRNIDDDRVLAFWRLFTLADEDVIQSIMRTGDINDQKIMLANAVTTLVHGVEEADRAHQTARAMMNGGIGPDTPVFDYIDEELIVEALVRTGLVSSKGDGDRQARNGGIKINGQVVKDIRREFTTDDLMQDGVTIRLSLGKKKVVAIRGPWEEEQ